MRGIAWKDKRKQGGGRALIGRWCMRFDEFAREAGVFRDCAEMGDYLEFLRSRFMSLVSCPPVSYPGL